MGTGLINCELDATANNVSTNRPVVTSAANRRLVGSTNLAGSNASAKNVCVHSFVATVVPVNFTV